MALAATASPRKPPYTNSEMSEELALLKRYRGNIYGAYKENPLLFQKTAPDISRLSLDGDTITDIQAAMVLPWLARLTDFDLSKCRHLTESPQICA